MFFISIGPIHYSNDIRRNAYIDYVDENLKFVLLREKSEKKLIKLSEN